MEEKIDMTPLTYSWGEFYETLKGMKNNGDDPCDALFDKAEKVFEKMEVAKTQKEVRNILHENDNFTEIEINRLNSKLFDGLLLADNTILNSLIAYDSLSTGLAVASRIHGPYIETYKFLLSKLERKSLNDQEAFFLYKSTIRGMVEYLKILLHVYPGFDTQAVRRVSDPGEETPSFARAESPIVDIFYDACEYDHLDIMKYIVANFSDKLYIGHTSTSEIFIHCLRESDNKEVIEFLFDSIDSGKLKTEYEGEWDFPYVFYKNWIYSRVKKDNDEIALIFVKKCRFMIDAENFINCWYSFCKETLIAMVEQGCQISVGGGWTNVINWAISDGKDFRLIKALLDRGFEPDIPLWAANNQTEELAIKNGVRDMLQYELGRRERMKSIGQ